MNKLILPGAILLGSLILGGSYYASQVSKAYPAEKSQPSETIDAGHITESLTQSRQVKLIYNNSTGELYPILPEGVQVHTCVWTIWGDHGSDTKLTTNSPFISNESNPLIKQNNFLPPRVPIYTTCIDWSNQIYVGAVLSEGQDAVASNTTGSPTKNIVLPAIDPTIKIEKCKAEAKIYADVMANRAYHKASDDYAAKGDYQFAAELLLKQPSEYGLYSQDYNSAYIKCLDN